MILVIDNYDSFTYNLVQYLGELGAEVVVKRNDAVTVDDIREIGPDGVLISPGPGRPEEAGVSLELIAKLGAETPIFGVCLGHQSIAQHFGALVVRAERLMHIPDELEVTAWTDRDEVMGLRHTRLPIEGVQFHPESFLTEHGHELISNWLSSLPAGRAS